MRLIDADKLAARIAGHSNYHGDSILSAIYCAAEGKENTNQIPTIDPIHAAGGCYCRECGYKDSNACPAYDLPMNRTSMRIKFCNCGKRKDKQDG